MALPRIRPRRNDRSADNKWAAAVVRVEAANRSNGGGGAASLSADPPVWKRKFSPTDQLGPRV